jgi:hypothetical protein
VGTKKKAVLEGGAVAEAAEEKKEEAAEEAVAEAGAPEGVEKKKKEPIACIHEHADVELRREFPDIFKTLMKAFYEGSLPALKMLLEIRAGKYGGPEQVEEQGGKSLGEMLMDELKRRQDEREAAVDAAKAVEQAANEAVGSNAVDGDAVNEGAKSGGEAE